MVVSAGVFPLCHLQVEISFTSFILTWMPFISFSSLIAPSRASRTALNRSDRSGHPWIVPDPRKGEPSSLSP